MKQPVDSAGITFMTKILFIPEPSLLITVLYFAFVPKDRLSIETCSFAMFVISARTPQVWGMSEYGTPTLFIWKGNFNICEQITI